MGREVIGDGWGPVDMDRLADLEENSKFLAALEAAGVDNWEGYEVACQIYNGELDPEDI